MNKKTNKKTKIENCEYFRLTSISIYNIPPKQYKYTTRINKKKPRGTITVKMNKKTKKKRK